MRACLPRSRNNGSITAPLPPDSITSSPLKTHPLSLFLPFHALFLRPVVSLSLSLSLALYHSFSTPLSVTPSEPRNGAQVPFLLSRLRFPRPPSFLYTTSFAVVGEGETPAFAVGEAVLFFPLIKADRCGSGCRDDGTGRDVGGGRCTGRVAGDAGKQRRWAEVVGRRWRRARHSMTCHVPTLPLTPPSPLARLDATVAVPYARSRYNHLLPPFPRRGCVCVYGKYSRVRPLISRRARYSYPAASSYEVFVPACLESRRQFWQAHALVRTVLTLRSIRLSLDYMHQHRSIVGAYYIKLPRKICTIWNIKTDVLVKFSYL